MLGEIVQIIHRDGFTGIYWEGYKKHCRSIKRVHSQLQLDIYDIDGHRRSAAEAGGEYSRDSLIRVRVGGTAQRREGLGALVRAQAGTLSVCHSILNAVIFISSLESTTIAPPAFIPLSSQTPNMAEQLVLRGTLEGHNGWVTCLATSLEK